MTKDQLKELFPGLKEDIDEWWNDELRSAGLLGCFDRVYGPRNPRREEFIKLLESEPDDFTRESGVPLSKQLK